MGYKIKRLNRQALSTMLASVAVSSSYATELKENEKIQQLDTVVLQATAHSVLETSQDVLHQVAGATNLIHATQIEQGSLKSSADVFAIQPGIYAQSPGNEGTKISIRGSGINRAPGAHASGIYVLLDDIPFTGPGGTPYELLEPWWLQGAEVYRGANGFERGALALGGAINYLSKTGKEAERLQLRYELGSHGYQKYAVSSGQQIGDLDYYLSLNASTYDGYQKHSAGDSQGVTANVGYQIKPNLETRFYLRYRETEHQTPGRLTKQQIQTDPTAANPYNLFYDTKRIQPGSTWLTNKTTYNLQSGGVIQAALAYHDYPMDLQESPYRTDVKYSDISASLSYLQQYQLFGLNSVLKAALRSTTHRPNSGVTESLRFDTPDYAAGTISRKYTYRGSDNVLQLSNDLEIQPNIWLTTGLAGIYYKRASEVYYPITNEGLNETDWDIAPRLGLRYALQPNTQIYANLSKSVEPAHPWSMIWSTNKYFDQNSGPASGRMRAPIHLDAQTAHSFEIGGRGENQLGHWDLSYYYSKLKNELLSVEISPMPNPIIAESNASDTVHEGIELGLNTALLTVPKWGDLSLIQSYNYSDFHYKNDVVFKDNQLAGLPKHYYQAQLRMDFYQGLYSSLRAEYASKIATDYANSIYSAAYTIWGMSIGYQAPNNKWHTWVDFNNMTDQHYAATVTPAYNDHGQDLARYTPGEGFSTYAGISMHF